MRLATPLPKIVWTELSKGVQTSGQQPKSS